MDILAHTLWANVGARGVNKLAENLPAGRQVKKFRMHIGWTAFWGVFPDLFAFTIPFVLIFYKIIFGGESFLTIRDHHGVSGAFDIASYLYQFSHSLVIFLLVFILVWVISRRPRWEMFGWALHIVIDIFSHSINFYPTPFLFPISEYRFPYGVQWSNYWYMIINYSALLLVWGGIFSKKLKRKI